MRLKKMLVSGACEHPVTFLISLCTSSSHIDHLLSRLSYGEVTHVVNIIFIFHFIFYAFNFPLNFLNFFRHLYIRYLSWHVLSNGWLFWKKSGTWEGGKVGRWKNFVTHSLSFVSRVLETNTFVIFVR